MDLNTACEFEEQLRKTVPNGWKVERHNTQRRSDSPPRYKVVADSGTGLSLVVNPASQLIHVTVSMGPGLAHTITAKSHGWQEFEDPQAAYDALCKYVTATYQRVCAQYLSILSGN